MGSDSGNDESVGGDERRNVRLERGNSRVMIGVRVEPRDTCNPESYRALK